MMLAARGFTPRHTWMLPSWVRVTVNAYGLRPKGFTATSELCTHTRSPITAETEVRKDGLLLLVARPRRNTPSENRDVVGPTVVERVREQILTELFRRRHVFYSFGDPIV